MPSSLMRVGQCGQRGHSIELGEFPLLKLESATCHAPPCQRVGTRRRLLTSQWPVKSLPQQKRGRCSVLNTPVGFYVSILVGQKEGLMGKAAKNGFNPRAFLAKVWFYKLFNSTEKRLARLLLLLANFGKEGNPEPIDAIFDQGTLAEMIGTTRPRVSSFMNKFRKLGFISYNGKVEVHRSLLNAVLHEKPEIDGEENQE